MNDHLGKPFKRKQLLDKVQHWLKVDSAGHRLGAPSTTSKKSPHLGFDQEALDELCSTMGREWVSRSLSELADHLVAFKDRSPAGGDPDVLAHQAHLLVARAGVLGFSELARLCGALEQACRRGEGLELAWSKVRQAALEVQGIAAQLLQRLSVHTG